jgi:molecular chaperone DnaK (HSP70)
MYRAKRLTIGVDFGTTYSGVAYSNLSDVRYAMAVKPLRLIMIIGNKGAPDY